jgi:plastocyanin
MKRNFFIVTASCLVAILATSRLLAEAPSTQPANVPSQIASVTGKIIVEGDVPLSEMVVYVEPADPSMTVSVVKETVKISQRGAKFSPALTIVSVGQTVEFLNDEDRMLEHNVFSNAPSKKFDLGMYPPGQSRSVTFDKPGPVMLYCSIHRYMDGVIFVSPTPYFSRVNPDSTYKIEGIPPGKWVVKTWQRRRRFKEATAPLNADPGASTSINLELHKR